ncbi:DUF4238 domain-containing protein [Hymenobacter sp. HMF4947]|uniref:DUF4238 domain-containing protein n=1 Tax=Hymenobacter ginkgonis TaxID=2682976 RepID=A0A7K1TDG0_9BACT|nr:DUF4238 domain-containing protein [Hymenobacter ginkgonis]MVN76445.1 DUF4238 domain-containing protein [Hymenobacter ginkgonis]
MGNKSKQQHTVPRTYLKHWKISDAESFVYAIDFARKPRPVVDRFGLNDSVFKRDRYYNDNTFIHPYALEEAFSKYIEPEYENIVNEIKEENVITQTTREKIIFWLYTTKMRNPVMRNNHERIIHFLMTTKARWGGRPLEADEEQAINQYSKDLAKKMHLGALVDENDAKDLSDLFLQTMSAKRWRILKSHSLYNFWTNDNPGFSPNVDERFAIDRPYHHWFELNAKGVMFFPLSPKYCLEISPFTEGTPLEVNALTMHIPYTEASLTYIDYINKGVFYTRDRFVISNNKQILESCIR